MAVFAIFVLSLFVQTVQHGIIPPNEVFPNLVRAIKIHIFGYDSRMLEMTYFSYYDTISRLLTSLMAFLCGAMLSLSGYVFQTVFKNPIAAPSVLGVSAGVRLGIILLVTKYGVMAETMFYAKYRYCYTFALLTLFAVLFLSRLSSRDKRIAIWDTLIIAVIFSTLLGAISTQLSYQMENDTALSSANISNVVWPDLSLPSFILLGIIFIITVLPFFFMRFSFNAVLFDDGLGKSTLGINTGIIKVIALILGSLMLTSATIHIGSVGMISLIVPFISRNIFGVESQKLFLGNIVLGGGICMLAKTIAAFIPFGNIMFPTGSIVEFLAIPVFVLIVRKGRFGINEI
jgi:iron complex transport system permease protein